jgi:hypothetical protein
MTDEPQIAALREEIRRVRGTVKEGAQRVLRADWYSIAGMPSQRLPEIVGRGTCGNNRPMRLSGRAP